MINLREKAIEYERKGVSVIPLKKDKTPLLTSWKEYQDRRATPDEINKWWATWPDAQIGIVTGKISNLLVIDVDVGGDETPFPKETTIVKTGNGGLHLYYRWVGEFPNKAGVFPHVDIRGDAGYVVAPPSVTEYEKDGVKKGGEYKILKALPFAPFPSELFVGLKKSSGSNIASIVKGVGEGSRNQTAAQMAGSLIQKYRADPTTAWELLQAWNDRNTPPLSERELLTTFNSILTADKRNNPEQKEETKRKGAFVRFDELVDRSMKELDATVASDCLSFGYDWLDDQLTGLFKGEMVVVGGETGVGKTSFVTNILYKTSRLGIPCAIFALEDRLNDYGIKAVYYEMGKIRKMRGKDNYPWNAYRRNEIKDPEYVKTRKEATENLRNTNLYFVEVQEQMNIELLEALIEESTKQGFKLFLIDHLHYFDLLRSDTSKADYIEKIMVRIKTLQNKTGARIIMVVHYKKLEGKKPTLDSFKDSISIVQNANYVINLWRDRSMDADRNQTFMYIPKARNPNGEKTLELRYDPAQNDYTLITQKFGTQIDMEAANKAFNQINL